MATPASGTLRAEHGAAVPRGDAQVVAAAAELFNRDGWRRPAGRIARAAGYAVGTFYKHFADKREPARRV
jgi:AcrR family transcriptional regulator